MQVADFLDGDAELGHAERTCRCLEFRNLLRKVVQICTAEIARQEERAAPRDETAQPGLLIDLSRDERVELLLGEHESLHHEARTFELRVDPHRNENCDRDNGSNQYAEQ